MSSLATSRLPEPTTIPWAPETRDLPVSGYALVEVRTDGSFGRSRLLPDAVPAGEVTAVRTALAHGDWSEVATTLVTSHAVVRLLAGTADASSAPPPRSTRSAPGSRCCALLSPCAVATANRPSRPSPGPVHRWGERTRGASSRIACTRLAHARLRAMSRRVRRTRPARLLMNQLPVAALASSPSCPSCSTPSGFPPALCRTAARGCPHPRSWGRRFRRPRGVCRPRRL